MTIDPTNISATDVSTSIPASTASSSVSSSIPVPFSSESTPVESSSPAPAVSQGLGSGAVAGIAMAVLLSLVILLSAFAIWWRGWQQNNRRAREDKRGGNGRGFGNWERVGVNIRDGSWELATLPGRTQPDPGVSDPLGSTWRSHLAFLPKGFGGKSKVVLSGHGRLLRDSGAVGISVNSNLQDSRPSFGPPQFPTRAHIYGSQEDGYDSMVSFQSPEQLRDFTNLPPGRHHPLEVTTKASDHPSRPDRPPPSHRARAPGRPTNPYTISRDPSPLPVPKLPSTPRSGRIPPEVPTSINPEHKTLEELLSRKTSTTELDAKYQTFEPNPFLNYYDDRKLNRQRATSRSRSLADSAIESVGVDEAPPAIPTKSPARNRYGRKTSESEVTERSAGHRVTGLEYLYNVGKSKTGTGLGINMG